MGGWRDAYVNQQREYNKHHCCCVCGQLVRTCSCSHFCSVQFAFVNGDETRKHVGDICSEKLLQRLRIKY